MVFTRMCIVGQLRALPRLQDAENNHADECAHELWQRGVDVQNSEIETRQLACRGGFKGGEETLLKF